MFSSCYVSAVQRKIPKTNVLHVLYFLCFATSWISREYLVFLVGVLFSFCLLLFFLDFGFLVVFYFFYETLYSLCCWGHNHICLSIYIYIYVRAMYIICTHEQHIGNTYMYILYVMCCNVLHPLPPPDGYQLSQGTSSP